MRGHELSHFMFNTVRSCVVNDMRQIFELNSYFPTSWDDFYMNKNYGLCSWKVLYYMPPTIFQVGGN